MDHKTSHSRLVEFFQPSDSTTLLFLSVSLGLATGIGVWVFRSSIEWFYELFVVQFGQNIIGRLILEPLHISPALAIIAVLAVAGLIVGFLMDRWVGHEKTHGVAAIMESVALAGGRLPARPIP